MRVVELAGPVGGGKSSMVERVRRGLEERGLAASRLDQVVRPGRIASAVLMLAFAVRHPQLAWHAGAALGRAPIPWWHRARIAGLVLGVGGRIMAAQRRVGRDHLVIVDEGLLHRSINLYAWYPRPPVHAIRSWVAAVPISGPVVLVNATPEAAMRRATRRGLPKRLTGRGREEVTAFMGRARDVILLAADLAEKRGASVVRVNNARSPDRAATRAVEAIVTLRRTAPSATPAFSAFRPQLPVVPRPDRLLRRAGSRRTARLDASTVAEILAAYRLTTLRSRSVQSPGGRGTSIRVATRSGEVVVKRYKPSQTAAAIAAEHSVLVALERHRYPAPRLRRTASGSTWVEHQGSCYAVYDFLAGYRHPHELLLWPGDAVRFQRLAGETLGGLHALLAEHTPPASDSLGFVSREGPRVRPVDWYVQRLADAPAPRRVRVWIEDCLRRLSEGFEARRLPRAVVHGDFGPYNLLVRSGARIVVIDWELARLDWRLVDLATALPRFAQRRIRFDAGAARQFLDGYRRHVDLRDDEARAIAEMLAFLTLQRAVVAWHRASEQDALQWIDEARRLILLAEDLIERRHPLWRVVPS